MVAQPEQGPPRLMQLCARFAASLLVLLALAWPAPARAGLLAEGISYRPGLQLDVHVPDRVVHGAAMPGTARLAPVVLYVHGGGWTRGDRKRVFGIPQWLNARGYAVVAIDYRKIPATDIGGQVADVAAALAWTRRNIRRHGGDPGRIVLMGHSAGAHLVALAAVLGKAGGVRGVVANDVQAYDLVAYAAKRGSIGSMFGAAFTDNPDNWVKWSPITHARRAANLPPHLILYSRSQGERRRSISIGYANVLKSRGTDVTVFDGTAYTHGAIAMRLGNPGDAASHAIERFLARVTR